MKQLLLTGFLILFFLQPGEKNLNAQNIEEIQLNESFQNQPLKEFFDTLESKYGIDVFYKKEWIDSFTISKNFKNTPLIQALNNIFLNHELTFSFYQNHAILIFPKISDTRSRFDMSSQVLIIGNPLNTGRYKTATITGKVVDGKTGEPLTGAVVYEYNTKKGATTNKNGEFEMELPTGDHELQFSFMGFQNTNLKVRLIEDGFEEFELFEESHNIGEVMIFGEESDLPRSQMSMIRMNSKEFKQLPALMGEVDILKGMTMLAGVQTVSELSSGFNVRGGNTDQNLILIEGSPVFNSSHLFGFLSLINPDVVNDVRLFKGGIPVKFGERVASVMEVDFLDGNSEFIRVRGGIGVINSRLTLDGPLSANKKLTFIAGGRSSYTDWILKQVPDPVLSQSVTQFYDASGKVSYKFNQHNSLSVMGYTSNDEFSTSSQSITQYGNVLAHFNLNTRFAEQLYGNLETAYSQYSYRLKDLANNNPSESYFLDNWITYSSAGYFFKWHPHPQHNAEFGAKGILYHVLPGEIVPAEEITTIENRKLDSEKTVEWAGYVGDEYEITSTFSVAAGLRYSHFSNLGSAVVYLYDPLKPVMPENMVDSIVFQENEVVQNYGGLEPRISFRFDLNPDNILKLNYQRTRQYMFQLSNNAVISPAETWKAADYHLKPLIADQIAAGIENESWLRLVDFTAEVYFKKLQNLIEYKNGARLIMNQQIETALISTKGYSWGVEFSATKKSGRLTGYASYVFSRTKRKSTGDFQEDMLWNGDYYPSIYDRPHDLSATATYNISRRWHASANFVFISGRPVTLPELTYEFSGENLVYFSERNKYRMPPYHRLDLSITFDENLRKKRMWKGSWTLAVYNFYGRKNPYSVYYRKTAPGMGNDFRQYSLYKLSVIGIPVPSLTYNFTF